MYEIKLYKSKSKAIFLFLISLGFMMTLLLIMNDIIKSFSFQGFIIILSILFCALGMLVGLFLLFDNRPQMIITESGISDRTTNFAEIKWEQIKEILPVKISKQQFVSVIVDNTYNYQKPSKFTSIFNTIFSIGDLNFNIDILNVNNEKLIDLFDHMLSTKKSDRKLILLNFDEPDIDTQRNLLIKKTIKYILLSLVVCILTLSFKPCFFLFICIIGISAFILKINAIHNIIKKESQKKILNTITYLGCANLIICFAVIKIFELNNINLHSKIKEIKEIIISYVS